MRRPGDLYPPLPACSESSVLGGSAVAGRVCRNHGPSAPPTPRVARLRKYVTNSICCKRWRLTRILRRGMSLELSGTVTLVERIDGPAHIARHRRMAPPKLTFPGLLGERAAVVDRDPPSLICRRIVAARAE